MKMNSDKGKFCLVLVVFIVILGFCFYKNLESNLKGYYSSRNFHGSIQIKGFSWEQQNDGPDMNYLYTEKINGKEISIPLEKALDINPERKPLEIELQNKINQASELKGTTIHLKESLSDGYLSSKAIFWYTRYETQSIEEKRTELGGWYAFPLKDALANDAIYVQIELPKHIDRLDSLDIDLPGQLKDILQKTNLPDGYYSLAIDGERVAKIVEIKKGKVEDWI